MKRRTNSTRHLRPARPAPRPDFDKLLVAHVKAHCPEHFSEQDGQRAIEPKGIISFLEAVIRGEAPGDPAFARATIHLLKNAQP